MVSMATVQNEVRVSNSSSYHHCLQDNMDNQGHIAQVDAVVSIDRELSFNGVKSCLAFCTERPFTCSDASRVWISYKTARLIIDK